MSKLKEMPKKHELIESKEKKEKSKPTRKLIFLAGFANTGKDTVGEMLKEISIEPMEVLAFADAVKAEIYPKLRKQYDKSTDDREWREKHRAEIIQYGEGQKREHGQYYWVQRTLDKVLRETYERTVDIPHILVTDCRRTEEVMWFKHFKLKHFNELSDARAIYEPILYVVHREGAEKDKDYLTHVALEYAAETRAFHRLIRNYKGKKELKNMLNDIYVRDIK